MFRHSTNEHRILCAICGVLTSQTPSNLCVSCIRSQLDITEGIPKSATLYFCKGCGRYLVPPSVWIKANPESPELLALCLKKIKGLNKVRLVDAKFIWTEPHSKRIQVKLKIEKEALSTIMQQTFMVEFVVTGQYCSDCQKVDAKQVWTAVVQVRQKVPFKRTFYWLEQVILKHRAHKNTTNIKEYKDGLDFYFGQRTHATQLVDFLQSVVPTKLTTSEHLVSRDVHTGKKTYKFSYSLVIVPICRYDLVCMSPKLASSLSGISPLCLCTKISNTITLMDLSTLKSVEVRPQKYWEASQHISIICDHRLLDTFYVIDVIPEDMSQMDPKVKNHATVGLCYPSNMEKKAIAKTNLGHLIKPGDYVLGYNLVNANLNSDIWDQLALDPRFECTIPEVVIVRKTYPRSLRNKKSSIWKLKNLDKQFAEEVQNKGGDAVNSNEKEYELFLREIEEDPEIRSNMNLYLDAEALSAKQKKKGATAKRGNPGTDMEIFHPGDGNDPESKSTASYTDSEYEDFPEIKIEHLNKDLSNLKIDSDYA